MPRAAVQQAQSCSSHAPAVLLKLLRGGTLSQAGMAD
jgi:hypothetical protein